MRTSSASREPSLFGRNAYLWAFIPAVVLLSVVVFAICLVAILFCRAKAGFA
jgi:F0F1-type ATP synthase membrane subunit c/vacuolar-type H+-ATPase subunit K